ncbi:Photosynthetic reaction centre, L/M [Cynara cardunculus var. scolymus]|uniref:Photosynthetic reaction centre, L/M n=1 Tax=Cynara cardunculus var. scolymus TaxID=59895 RepID=A0A118JWQ7_CYNCS|nr:Photosynthetic reaction centre, L/M [Cynara cardunculus var. scolymus]
MERKNGGDGEIGDGGFHRRQLGVRQPDMVIEFAVGESSMDIEPISYMGVAGVLDDTLLCALHGVTVENTLFKDGDGDDANTFRAFNLT